MSNQQEKFEQWARTLGLDVRSYVYEGSVEYLSISTNYAWKGWIARCELHGIGDE